ncbi:hypothetical protein HHI36_018607 [Cryptolaemus montrouzieri]|uniref:DDE-1 domain-containing protein n=1 Tax=Cryptolaemus montrouzieri TaxID=559131 RepID=A0ABD2P0J4_9CUCU
MHYRKEVVRRSLADLELHTPTLIDVLQAMWMTTKAWNLVTEKTIANCFKKSGFKVTCEDTFDNDSAVCGELTDADIITSMLPVTNAEADKDEEEGCEIDEHNFTIKDAYNASNIIKYVFLKKRQLFVTFPLIEMNKIEIQVLCITTFFTFNS